MMKKYLLLLAILLASSFVYADTAVGTFNVSNVPPPTPFDWQPTDTHWLTQEFTWNESIDQNGDEIYTYVCITNDTDVDDCSVADEYTNAPSQTMAVDDTNWDYAPFGTDSRTYYVKLTPYDGSVNGTANDTISFTLTDKVPSIDSSSVPIGGSDCDVDAGEESTITFSLSLSDNESDDMLIRVCTTNSINSTTGLCSASTVCSTSYSQDLIQNCTNNGGTISGVSSGAGDTAYAFVCDSVGNDTNDPSQCDPVGTAVTYYVNQVPAAASGALVTGGAGDSGLTCSGSSNGFGTGDVGPNSNTGILEYSWSIGACDGSSTCDESLFVACDVVSCTVTPTDNCGVSGTSDTAAGYTISNTPPQFSAVTVQNSASNHADITGNASSTHDDTPTFRVTFSDDDITDGASQEVTATVKLSSVGPGLSDAGTYSNSATANGVIEINATTPLTYDGLSKTYYVTVSIADDASCLNNDGTTQYYEFELVNKLPNLASINVSMTHDNPINIEWVINDSDDGTGMEIWPADDEWDYTVFIIDKVNGTTYCNFTGTASSKTNDLTTCTLPWGDTGVGDYANRTFIFRLDVQDRFTGGADHNHSTDYIAPPDARIDQEFTLYDYLPDVTEVLLTDVGSYSDCNVGGCALTPVAGSNTSFAAQVTVTDTDGDCATTTTANIGLCINTTGCDYANAEFAWNLDNIEVSGNDCIYSFTANKTAADGTPQFWRLPNSGYYLHAQVLSDSVVEKPTDTEARPNWQFGTTPSLDYPDLVFLGNGTLDLGRWNDGTALALATNFGNAVLELNWSTTNPTSGVDTWVLNGTDLKLDEDASYTNELGGLLMPMINLHGNETNFNPSPGLEICLADTCDDAGTNETLDTYYHAHPPEGLTAGTYNSTITITLYS